MPRKYRVDGKWYLQAELLKSAPRDEKSNELIEQRDEEEEEKETKFIEQRVHDITKNDKGQRRSKRFASKEASYKMLNKKAEQQDIDKMLDEIDDEKAGSQKKKPKKLKVKKDEPKSLKHRVLIKYLKKKGLPTGGSIADLRARVDTYKKSKTKPKPNK